MHRKILAFLFAAVLLSSCTDYEVEITDDFVIYSFGQHDFSDIGYRVGDCIQGLIRGEIECFGFNDEYISVKVAGEFFYFDKDQVKASQRPKDNIVGPLSYRDFSSASKKLHLPPTILVVDENGYIAKLPTEMKQE